MTDPAAPALSRRSRWTIYVGVAIVLVFIAAMVTQYLQTRRVREELARTRAELAVVRSEATIGAAAAEAQQGRYEPARRLASRFFTALQERVLALPPDERAPLQALLDRRDVTITLLSRGDQAAAGALQRLVTDYRTLLHGDSVP